MRTEKCINISLQGKKISSAIKFLQRDGKTLARIKISIINRSSLPNIIVNKIFKSQPTRSHFIRQELKS